MIKKPLRQRLHPLALTATLLAGCANTSTLYQSEDWTAPGTFTKGIEGPAVDASGNLYAVNFAREGSIGVVDKKASAHLFVTLPKGSTANAIRFAPSGEMLVADYTGHSILQINKHTKAVSVYAHNDAMHQPNDFVIADSGIIYASDPDWANNTGQLWRINKDGTTHLLEAHMGTTNGIELSPSGHKLYVNESAQRNIWVYDVNGDGSLSHKRLFFTFPDFGMDGMSVDTAGNLYVARYGAGNITVLSPAGKLLRKIALTGQFPTNITFGGHDGKRAFVTLQKRGTIESFTVNIPGSDWLKMHRDTNF